MTLVHRNKRRRLSEDAEAVTTALADLQDDFHEPSMNDPDLNQSKPYTKPGRSLFVRSLPSTITDEALADHFSQSYPLKHAIVVLDRDTKESKGYGFVTFADAADAQRAREEFDATILDGKQIKVDIAKARIRGVETRPTSESEKFPSNTSSSEADRTHSKQKDLPQSSKLIIRNLPWSIKTSDQLALLFRSYGKVKQAFVPKKRSGLSPGFGFVVLRGRKNAEKAISGVNGKTVDGRVVAVDWAMDKATWQHLQADCDVHPSTPLDRKTQTYAKVDSQSHPDLEDTEASSELQTTESHRDNGARSRASESSDIESDLDSFTESASNSSDQNRAGNQSQEDLSSTLFIRNLPFTATDSTLSDHFKQFGLVRYARVVVDPETERSRGVGFVCFRNADDTLSCLRGAPKPGPLRETKNGRADVKHSVLEDTQADPLGRFSMDGRVLQISRAVGRAEAQRLNTQGQNAKDSRQRDKRRLFLLSEGTISPQSPFYATLSPPEIKMREDSAKQRQTLVKNNPTLHISLTRLSVRNIPRHLSSKDLKALAREAVVGFAKDIKEGRRERLSKEELQRGGDSMKQAEKQRKLKGKGIVKQAHIVFEARDGSKVGETTGAGRSRGYGFIEYASHRWALMGLRWLNGARAGQLVQRDTHKDVSKDVQDHGRRLIVEFAIENAQVVTRREAREEKARQHLKSQQEPDGNQEDTEERNTLRKAIKGRGLRPKGLETSESGKVQKRSISPKAKFRKSKKIRGKGKVHQITAKKKAPRKLASS